MRSSKVLLCAAVVAMASSCAGDPSETTTDPSASSVCTTVQAGGGWWNLPIGAQTGRFHVELDARPSEPGVDVVVGLTNGAASKFSQLAAAVRFNPGGTIDARDGATYRSDSTWTYQAGQAYHFRLDVDVASHTYDAWVRLPGASFYEGIGQNLAFRTEQASVAKLDNVTSEVDSTSGAVEVCGVAAVADTTTADGCVVADSSNGFLTQATPDGTTMIQHEVTVTPSSTSIDAVVGLTAGTATSFKSLATAVRFSPDGIIDVRDGDTYRAATTIHYQAGVAYRVLMVVDLASHTSTTFVAGGGGSTAIGYASAFRTQQASVTHLDHQAAIVDGTAGTIRVCAPRTTVRSDVSYVRPLVTSVAPMTGGAAAIASATSTQLVNAAGMTTSVIDRGGKVAVDASGIVYIANATGGIVTIASYAGTSPRWTHTYNGGGDVSVAAISAAGTGAVTVALAATGTTTIQAVQQVAASDGTPRWTLPVQATAIGFDARGFTLASSSSTNAALTRYTQAPAVVWTRGFPGHIWIAAVATDATGATIFGGNYAGTVNFGGQNLAPFSNPDAPMNGYIVKLSPSQAHVYSERTETTDVTSIATNTSRTVVSGTLRTQFHHLSLQSFDASGAPIAGPHPMENEHGRGADVVLGSTGRIWWNVTAAWQVPVFETPFLLAY